MATRCQPAAVLSGENELVTRLEVDLLSRQIATTAAAGCPAVRAHVTQQEREIAVQIEDWDGRISERVVTDTAAAATLIESWARRDISHPLLALSRTETTATPPPPEPAGPVVSAAPAALTRLVDLRAAGDISSGFDGSMWFGGHLSGCVRADPVCVGAQARLAYDPAINGETGRVGTRRIAADLLLIVDFPLSWERVSFTPGVGVGVGWVRSFGDTYEVYDPFHGDDDDDDDDENVDDDDDDDDNDNDDSGDEEDEEDPDDDEFDHKSHAIENAGGLRLDAHLCLAFLFSDHFRLEIGVAVGVSLFAQTKPYDYDGWAIAGEPRGFARAFIGLGFSL